MKVNSNFLKIALKAAREAGEILERNFGRVIKVSLKKERSLVSKIDFEAEKVIIRLIKKNFPSHKVFAEEEDGVEELKEGYTWIIDPLDGTTNYVSSFPFFAVSIALVYKREPILGVVFNPLNKEFYFAEKGKGAYFDGKRIKIAKRKLFSDSLLLLGKGRNKEDFLKLDEIFRRAIGQYRTCRIWGATSLELCYIASGRAYAHINTGSKPWDYAAGVLVVKEAGGRVTDFEGKEWKLTEKNVIASNKEANKALLGLVN